MKDTTLDLIGQQIFISGRVQGVFYRRFAKKAAEALAITGWVRNLPDARVEVHAFGTTSQLSAYQTQLKAGPPAAKVKEILIQPIVLEHHVSFQIIT